MAERFKGYVTHPRDHSGPQLLRGLAKHYSQPGSLTRIREYHSLRLAVMHEGAPIVQGRRTGKKHQKERIVAPIDHMPSASNTRVEDLIGIEVAQQIISAFPYRPEPVAEGQQRSRSHVSNTNTGVSIGDILNAQPERIGHLDSN